MDDITIAGPPQPKALPRPDVINKRGPSDIARMKLDCAWTIHRIEEALCDTIRSVGGRFRCHGCGSTTAGRIIGGRCDRCAYAEIRSAPAEYRPSRIINIR